MVDAALQRNHQPRCLACERTVNGPARRGYSWCVCKRCRGGLSRWISSTAPPEPTGGPGELEDPSQEKGGRETLGVNSKAVPAPRDNSSDAWLSSQEDRAKERGRLEALSAEREALRKLRDVLAETRIFPKEKAEEVLLALILCRNHGVDPVPALGQAIKDSRLDDRGREAFGPGTSTFATMLAKIKKRSQEFRLDPRREAVASYAASVEQGVQWEEAARPAVEAGIFPSAEAVRQAAYRKKLRRQ